MAWAAPGPHDGVVEAARGGVFELMAGPSGRCSNSHTYSDRNGTTKPARLLWVGLIVVLSVPYLLIVLAVLAEVAGDA